MSSDLTFEAITGFRLVAANPGKLARFYRAIGFEVGEAVPIAPATIERLGLTGAGSRIPMSLGPPSLGPSRVELEGFDPPGRSYPAEAAACDLIFQHLALVTDDAEAAWRRARDAGATLISREGPVTLPKSAGGVTAVKFRDPEGHPLEFLQFPRGANPAWTGRGVMGIDHSAVSVSALAASRRFYERHGLGVERATLNHGPTQVALDGLDGVVADVVAMKPKKGRAHVELLAYRHPIGRGRPPLAANDIAATRIVWRSNGDALVRDPDGHLHQLSR